MLQAGVIDVDPSFQRRPRWDPRRQSALIESFLLNIPVPPIYLAEEESGVYSVIDGQQRLRSIERFMHGELALKGLDRLPELAGYRFPDLPRELQNPLRIRPYLRAVTLLKQSDPELRYEVFTRLNTGGVQLNAQEIRNVAFRGPLNDLVYRLSEDPFLRRQLKITSDASPAYRTMVDAEFVLRFLTLLETWSNFSGDLAQSMNAFMRDDRHPSPARLKTLEMFFRRSLSGCEALWGEHAFQRVSGNGWREQALAGMYDAEMVGVALINDDVLDALVKRNQGVIQGTRKLFDDEAFEEAVRVGTNTPSRVQYRIQSLEHMLRVTASR
jgi:hypothetical protein